MGVYRHFPYTNFHEMNLDEIIKIVREMVEEWAQYHAQWDEWMGQINDDWSNYQEVMNEAWQDMRDYINNYFDNLNVQTEINNKITSMVLSGEFAQIVDPYVPPAVSTWLADHITEPVGVVIDTSLSVSGACADAKVVGDALNEINSEIHDDFITLEKSFTNGYFALTNPVNILEPTPYTASYTGSIVWDKCNQGDIYKLTNTALLGLYPYVIYDSDGNIVEHGEIGAGVTDQLITIPENGAFFGANLYGISDSVQKKTSLPKQNKFNINRVKKEIDITFNHSYIGTTSPLDVDNPTITSGVYTGGYVFDPCTEGDIYIIKTDNGATAAYDILICDEDGDIIEHSLVGRSGKHLENWYVEIPENGAYLGVNCLTASSHIEKYVNITYELLTKTNNPFSGLNGVAFGTSLTSRSDEAGTYGYLSYLRQLLDCTIENKGVGSAYWFLVAYDSRSVTYNVESYTDYADKDFAIIEGCVNDWFTSKILGTYTDNAYTSVCGCLRKMIEHIFTQNPNIQIFVILDHQGRDYAGLDCSSSAVVNGKTQYEYYTELKKVCELYSIPVICEYAESNIGIFGTQYLVDNIHCNDLGAKQSAHYIANEMQKIGLKVKSL